MDVGFDLVPSHRSVGAEKKEILDSFNCEHFNGEELVIVVGTSGLFSREDVEEMFVERFR